MAGIWRNDRLTSESRLARGQAEAESGPSRCGSEERIAGWHVGAGTESTDLLAVSGGLDGSVCFKLAGP